MIHTDEMVLVKLNFALPAVLSLLKFSGGGGAALITPLPALTDANDAADAAMAAAWARCAAVVDNVVDGFVVV